MLWKLFTFLLSSAVALLVLAGLLSLWGGWGLAVAAVLALAWVRG